MINIQLCNINFDKGIKIIETDTGEISLSIEGHSGYDFKGKDPICAAVSALGQTIIISITRIIKVDQLIDQKDGFLKTVIKISKLDEEKLGKLEILLNTFIIGIFEIIKNYPDNIKLDFIKNEDSR